MSEKPRIVVDTQILFRTALNHKSLPAKLLFQYRDHYQLLVSEEIQVEARDVLYRPSLRTRFPHLTDEVAENILAVYESAEWVTLDEIAAISRDPKDDMVLATALIGSADYIVSEDKDLLSLNPYEDIQIIDALAFLHILEPPSEET